MHTILISGTDIALAASIAKALLSPLKTQDPHIRVVLDARNRTKGDASVIAEDLVDRGVEVMRGDLGHLPCLLDLLKGVEVAVLTSGYPGGGKAGRQVEDARVFVDAAEACGVGHVIFNSVPGAKFADEGSKCRAQYEIERIVRASDLEWTILRSGYILDQIPSSRSSRASSLSASAAMYGNAKISWISREDVGKAVANVVRELGEHSRQIYNITAAVASIRDIEDMFERVEGVRVGRRWMPKWYVMARTDRESMVTYKLLTSQHGDAATPRNIEETKLLVPDILDLEAWVRKRQWQMKEAEVLEARKEGERLRVHAEVNRLKAMKQEGVGETYTEMKRRITFLEKKLEKVVLQNEELQSTRRDVSVVGQREADTRSLDSSASTFVAMQECICGAQCALHEQTKVLGKLEAQYE